MNSSPYCLTLVAVFLANMLMPGGTAQAQSGVCGIWVTERECRIYLDKLEHARTVEERTALEKCHSELLRERERMCPRPGPSAGTSANRPFNPPTNPIPKVWM